MSNRIYFILEIKKRELLSRIFATIHLLNKNFEVVIGKKYSFQNYYKFLKNGIYLFKGFGPKNLYLLKKIKSDGNQVVGMDEEGLMISNHREIKDGGRINKNCMELADLFFCWGEYHKEQILKLYPNYADKIRSIGNLRLDVAKENLNKMLENETFEIKKKYNEFILLTTKFSSINNSGYKKFSDTREFPFREYIFQKKIMEKTIEFLKLFDKEKIKLVLRPHPVENRNFWVSFLKENNLNNIILADDYFQTNSYLNACKLNISSNCTTSLEAVMLNKKTINFTPYRDDLIEFELFNKISFNCHSVEDLIQICKNFEIDNESFTKDGTEMEYYLKKYIGNYKKNCIELMIEEFNKLNSKIKNNNKKKDQKTSIFYFLYFKFIRIIKNLYYRFKSESNNEFNHKENVKLAKSKFSGLTKKELYTMIQMFDFIREKMGFNIDIKEIYPGCILFKKRSKN